MIVELVINGERYCYNAVIDKITQEYLFTNIDFCSDFEMQKFVGFNYHQINRILERRQAGINYLADHIARALQDFISKRDTFDGHKHDKI